MNVVYITGGLTPYRIAFCDCVNNFLQEEGQGSLTLYILSPDSFNSNYDNKELMRPYVKILKGKTIVCRDNTTRFMINPSIAKEVLNNNPDFIVLGGSWTHPSTWILLKNKKKIEAPIYFWAESHFHNGLARKKKKIWKEMLKRIIYNQFDGFFVPGKYAMEAIEETKCKQCKNCIQLPNLVDNKKYYTSVVQKKDQYVLREKYEISKEQIVLFTPSRLVDLKGIVEFIENGKNVLSGSNFTWIIAGIGPLEDKISKLANEYQIDLRILGFLGQDKIVECFTIADWFLLPSLSDPNPLSVIEALWAGMPLALSKYVGNNPESLESGENGVLFDTLSTMSVEQALRTMKSSSKEWIRNASKRSIEIAMQRFDLNIETKKFIRNIKRIVEER